MNIEYVTSRLLNGTKIVFIVVTLIYSHVFYAQNLTARVLDLNKAPIKDAKVFYNKTSVFTYTNKQGEFTLPLIPGISNLKLVLYHPSYKIHEVSVLQGLGPEIYLSKKTDIIRAKEAESNMFPQDRMYDVFIENFLGKGKNTKKTMIENKDSINLFFNELTHTLHANTSGPLYIVNKALGYNIEYYLIDFRIEYSINNLHPEKLDHCFNYGYSLFDDIDSTKVKERAETYEFTLQHFFKQIINNNTRKTKYKIVIDHEEVDITTLFKVTKTIEGYYKLNVENASIDYEENDQFTLYIELHYQNQVSRILLYQPFIIVDENGNIVSKDSIEISGSILGKGLSEELPLDYNIIE